MYAINLDKEGHHFPAQSSHLSFWSFDPTEGIWHLLRVNMSTSSYFICLLLPLLWWDSTTSCYSRFLYLDSGHCPTSPPPYVEHSWQFYFRPTQSVALYSFLVGGQLTKLKNKFHKYIHGFHFQCRPAQKSVAIPIIIISTIIITITINIITTTITTCGAFFYFESRAASVATSGSIIIITSTCGAFFYFEARVSQPAAAGSSTPAYLSLLLSQSCIVIIIITVFIIFIISIVIVVISLTSTKSLPFFLFVIIKQYERLLMIS